MQFGFMTGKGTTDDIFIVRRIQEKFRAKGKKIYFGFVDLEKTCKIWPGSSCMLTFSSLFYVVFVNCVVHLYAVNLLLIRFYMLY